MSTERIILDLPHGSTPLLAIEAAALAYRFARDHLDRQAGRGHLVVYDGLLRAFDAEVWWTARRAVAVRVRRPEPA